MSTPQDSRARKRMKKRRTLKNQAWTEKRARENEAASQPKAGPKKAT